MIKTNLKDLTSSNTTSNTSIPPYQSELEEAYMNPKQKDHFRKLLLLRLQSEMNRTECQLQNEVGILPDISDRASKEEAFYLEVRTRDRNDQLIKKIKEAIHNLDTGRYGFCDACDGHIGIQRLEARPMATLCIDCKILDEIKEKQQGG